ncbi:inositol monophosphatase [Uliginosibacterium sp. TH139]|uniref:inositol monophosphatase family protein n=1 Tax=Uliginosibacterium sp. TH139 TaxID=2067453 RepID=UPI000C7CA735|nr:inositol monophosphatase [Uliginosibacterium sp. TH139]PLK49397.1 inositol monophosphatase [Uliginosibacterium sp. TH139]
MPLLARARALESVVRDVAREAIMPHFLRAAREFKDDGSSVTAADLASQQALLERLPEVLDAPVIGEEMTPEQQLECWQAGQEGVWCIDPIDGTTNFANGVPLFAVSVAYLVGGETQFGVVYNPTTDESFYAAKGAGAWLNGKRLPLRAPAKRLAFSVAGIDFKRIPNKLAANLVMTPPYYSQRNFGSSALEWCFVAAGRLDVYLHGGQALWDYAAGRLILEEAGGVYGVLDGGPLEAAPLPKRAVVLAADPGLYGEWLAWLQAHRK